MSRRFVLMMLIVLVLCTLFAGTALAQAPTTKQVGLVIAFPDGTEHLEIVTVPTAATTFAVLQKAKITLASDDGGFGPGVCGINSVGCPATNCFCDAAHYWAYFNLDGATSNGLPHLWAWAASFPPTAPSWASPGADSMRATTRPFSRRFTPSLRSSAKTSPPPVSVPEPGTILLLGSGLAGVAAYVRLRKSR